MTDKQFTFHISELDEVIITRESDGVEAYLGNEECIDIDYIVLIVDLLNELHEENESLKLENKLLLEEMKEIKDKRTVYLQIKRNLND